MELISPTDFAKDKIELAGVFRARGHAVTSLFAQVPDILPT